MPGAARLTDKCSYHDVPNTQASPDVIVNNLGVHRMTDLWGNCACIKLVQGSPDIIVNNLPAGRCGDLTYISAVIVTCSGDTFYNG